MIANCRISEYIESLLRVKDHHKVLQQYRSDLMQRDDKIIEINTILSNVQMEIFGTKKSLKSTKEELKSKTEKLEDRRATCESLEGQLKKA